MLDRREFRPAQPSTREADDAGGDDDQRERRPEEEDRHEGDRRYADHDRIAQRTFADPNHRLDHDGEDRRFQAVEQGFDETYVAIGRVDVAEPHDGEDAGQDEQSSRHDAAAGPVQQPADVGRKLLGLGPRQQHAVVEGVQETPLGDPVLLLDQDAVHHRDLAGGAAQA